MEEMLRERIVSVPFTAKTSTCSFSGGSRSLDWLNDCMEDSMIAGKVQRWEGRVDVCFPSSVIFPGLNHLEFTFQEKDEVLWIHIALFALFRTLRQQNLPFS